MDAPSMSIGFLENKGQIIDQKNKPNKDVLFLLPGPQANMQLRKTGFSYDIYTREVFPIQKKKQPWLSPMQQGEMKDSIHYRFHRIDIEWIKANKKPIIIKEGKSQDYRNYFTTGTGEKGAKRVHHYQKVIYQNVWDHIDVEFLLTKNGPKFNYIVHPGGDPKNIQWKYKGDLNNCLEKGQIVLESTEGNMNEHIPASYFLEDQQPLEVQYTKEGKHYGFNARSSAQKTLVIDPVPSLLWSSFWGGAGISEAGAHFSNDHIIFEGYTDQTTNVATAGAYQSTLVGLLDATIHKYTKDRILLWGTYIGGSQDDYSGDFKTYDNKLFFFGLTESTNFPTTSGKYQTSHSGDVDVFVCQFSQQGDLVWSSFIGGSEDDNYSDVVFFGSSMYLAGTTYSYNNIGTTGAHQSTKVNYGTFFDSDGFIMKLDTGMVTKSWGTYIGGNERSGISGIAMDKDQRIHIAGPTYASNIATTNAHNTTNPSLSNDGYVQQYDTTGTQIWSTYYGDAHSDGAYVYGFNGTIYTMTYVNSSYLNSNNCAPLGWSSNYSLIVETMDSLGFPSPQFFLPADQYDSKANMHQNDANEKLVTMVTNYNFTGLYNAFDNTADASGFYDAVMAKFSNNNLTWLTYINDGGSERIRELTLANDSILISVTMPLTFQGTTDSILGSAHNKSGFSSLVPMLFRDTCNDLSLANYGVINGSNSVCPYDTVHYDINPQLFTDFYEWEVPTGASVIKGQGEACVSVVFDTVSGDVTVSPRNACDTATTITLAVTVNLPPAQPHISPADTVYICPSDTLALTSDITGNILWSSGDTANNILIDQAGRYTLTHIDTSSCGVDRLDSVWVLWAPTPDTPTVSPSGIVRVCAGDSVQLTASVANAYAWSSNDSSQSIWANQAGYYALRTSDTNACWSFLSDSVQVIIDQPLNKPILYPSDSIEICQGDSSLVFAQASGTVIWNNGHTGSSFYAKSSGALYVYATDSGGCSDVYSDTLWVNVQPLPTTPIIVLYGNDTLCLGDSVQVSSSTGQNVIWSTGDTASSIWVNQNSTVFASAENSLHCLSDTSNNISVVVETPPSKPVLSAVGSLSFCDGDSVLLQVNSPHPVLWNDGDTTLQRWGHSNGSFYVQTRHASVCPAAFSDTLDIQVYAKPNAPSLTVVGDSSLCQGNAVVLQSSESTGNRWSTGDTTQTINISAPMTVWLWHESTQGCLSDSVSFTVQQANFSVGNDVTICAGEWATLEATGNGNFQWNTGESSSTIDVQPLTSTTYWATDLNTGCSDSVSVNVIAAPVANFNVNPSQGAVPLNVQFTNTSTGATSYTWDFGDGKGSSDTDPAHTFEENGIYRVILVATNDQGCSDTAVFEGISAEGTPDFFIPNSFSPNRDGTNDVFEMHNIPQPYKFTVFNRWGQIIYHSNDYQNNWDGTHGGETLPLGSYSYKIEYIYIHPLAQQQDPPPPGKIMYFYGVLNVVK